ncbi:PepSY-associated TM helix domain-containing protein [Pseudocnuella soli]|uniref:PepSY-associated TM helix domain-containing protein n=1 Tax=Pseudocnuella soli TaxID=2502779 RepID=UPI00104F8D61|nr:PepSY-associated TM helix domain-containing protein [Pseudocnuella soli]
MTTKKIVLQIHLWLGLLSGLVILFLGVTGCILAFQREIESATQPYRYVQAEARAQLAPSVLQPIAEKQLPGKHVHAVMYQGRERAAEVIFYHYDLATNTISYYYHVYVNPYSGEVLKVKNMDTDFFRVVTMGHYYLWLPAHIGQPIVASATLIFVVLMISGLVLWWPRNKAARKQRFSIKWNVRWRRRNYDLHNVLGFYMTWLAIILAFTGLVWGFQWFANGAYPAAGGQKELLYTEPFSDTTASRAAVANAPAIDQVWQKMQVLYPTAEAIEVHPPESAASPIAANANPDRATYWKIDYRYFDQYTLKELPVDHVFGRFGEAAFADKLFRMNYDLHTGAVIGLAGKILMFFASLIAASLPVTGFAIWWGRRRKKSPAKKVVSTLEPAVA